MSAHRLVSSLLAAVTLGGLLIGTTGAASADPAPRPDPWVQGQIDAQTENVPRFLDAINRSTVDRSGINDQDLVIKGHRICDQIYSGRGDISGAALPHTQPDDFRSMEIVSGASVKYLCPPAAKFVGPNVLNAVR